MDDHKVAESLSRISRPYTQCNHRYKYGENTKWDFAWRVSFFSGPSCRIKIILGVLDDAESFSVFD